MADKEDSTSGPDTLDEIFGTFSASISAPIKTEIIIPDGESHFGVKTEALTVDEIKMELETKQRQIRSINEEVLALQTKLSQEVDPIKISSEQNMSLNLLSCEEQDILGSLENPVTLSSDDDEEKSLDEKKNLSDGISLSSDENSTNITGHNWWVNKDRYIYDMTDANNGNVDFLASPSSHEQSLQLTLPVDQLLQHTPPDDQLLQPIPPDDQLLQPTHPDDQLLQPSPPDDQLLQSSPSVDMSCPDPESLVKSSTLVSDKTLVSTELFETAFSKQVNKKHVRFCNVSSDESTDIESEEPIDKQRKKQLSPNLKSRQKIALSKTVNKDGSKSVSACILVSSSLPPQSQDSGVFSENSQQSAKGKGVGKNRSTRSRKVSSEHSPLKLPHLQPSCL